MPYCKVYRSTGYCPYCYSGRRGRRFYKNHYGWRPVRLKFVSPSMSVLKRSSNGAVSVVTAVDPETCKVSLKAVAICELLSLEQWDDGKKRKTGSMTLFFEEGQFKAWINDKDGGRVACISHDSLGGLLSLIERKVGDDSLEWRRARPDAGRGRK